MVIPAGRYYRIATAFDRYERGRVTVTDESTPHMEH